MALLVNVLGPVSTKDLTSWNLSGLHRAGGLSLLVSLGLALSQWNILYGAWLWFCLLAPLL